MSNRKEVGSSEARAHLSRLLARVARGERITITRQGVPVAMLVPIEKRETLDHEAAVEAIRAFAKEHTLGGVSIRELIEEGRKY